MPDKRASSFGRTKTERRRDSPILIAASVIITQHSNLVKQLKFCSNVRSAPKNNPKNYNQVIREIFD